MKFALITDTGIVSSYICQNNKVYLLESGEPYYRLPHISNECMMGFWNYPVLFDGYFINLREGILPEEELDVIFASIEVDSRNLDIIKNAYPKAKIFGSIKELEQQRNPVRQYVIDNTDAFIEPFLTYNFLSDLGYNLSNTNIVKILQPINIEYLRSKYITQKQNKLFNYENHWHSGRGGHNHTFLNLIDNIEIIQQKPAPNDWQEFIQSWNECQYMLNLDPMCSVGQQATQCAALGIIMLGGLNDAHNILFPEFATMDVNRLKQSFDKCRCDQSYSQDVVAYSQEMLKNHYSFEVVKKQIKELV